MVRRLSAVLAVFLALFSVAFALAQEEFEPEGDTESDYDDALEKLDTTTSGDWQYFVQSDGTLAVARYNGEANDLAVPAMLDSLPVTAIYSFCFPSNTLTHISLPACITTLYTDAFMFSTATQITLNEGLRTIGVTAFFSCDQLSGLTIPSTVEAIDSGAFENCASLTGMSILNGVTTLGDNVFLGCDELDSVYVPASVTAIGEDAFPDHTPFTLRVDAGSYAETYARQNGIPFELVPASE